jgi:hypothetical protein
VINSKVHGKEIVADRFRSMQHCRTKGVKKEEKKENSPKRPRAVHGFRGENLAFVRCRLNMLETTHNSW